MIHFAAPLWLAVGLLTCGVAVLYLRATGRRRQVRLQRFVSSHLLDRLVHNLSPGRRRLKLALLLLGLLCCFLALARPQYGYRWEEVRQRGIDILLAVDTSKSMLTPDVQPNRLARAKLAIRDFISRLQGDRVGLLPFAGASFLLCPLTTDYDAFADSLDALDTNLIPRPGTDLAGVIREGCRILAGKTSHKFLILVTDGENLEGDVRGAAQQAREENLTIFTVGVGTPEGELIPLQDGGSFLKDDKGRFVTSKLDAETLRTIARITGGIYVNLGNTGQGFDTIYARKLAMVPKEELGERMRRIAKERFGWPLALALLLLTLEYLTGSRATSLLFWKRNNRAAPLTILLLATSFLLAARSPLLGSPGESLVQAGQFDEAAQYYDRLLEKHPGDPRLHYNRGVAAYRRGRFGKALEHFNQALKTDDLQLQADTYYNLGNTGYQLGRARSTTTPQDAIRLWEQAIRNYDGCLHLDPDNRDAAFNRDLVQKELDRLKQRQEQEKQQEQNRQDNRQDKTQKEDDKKKQGAGSSEKEKQEAGKKQGQEPSPQGSGQQQRSASGRSNQAKQGDRKSAEQNQDRQAAASQEKEKAPDPKKGRQGTAMSKQDRDRRQQGRMTVGEARALLDSLAEEEGKLNFIPQMENDAANPPQKDW